MQTKSNKDYFFVSIQGLFFLAYCFELHLWEFSIPVFLRYFGLFIGIAGVVVLLLSILKLSLNLSPFPTPKEGSELVTSGLYKFARHPIYTGILMIFFGCGIYFQSEYKLLLSIGILILFYFKSEYEERLLQSKFEEYHNYKKKTGRFFPRFF